MVEGVERVERAERPGVERAERVEWEAIGAYPFTTRPRRGLMNEDAIDATTSSAVSEERAKQKDKLEDNG